MLRIREFCYSTGTEARLLLICLLACVPYFADLLTIWSHVDRGRDEVPTTIAEPFGPTLPSPRPIMLGESAETIKNVIATILGRDIGALNSEVKLVTNLGADELDLPMVAFALEDSFGCELDYERWRRDITVGQIVAAVKTNCDI